MSGRRVAAFFVPVLLLGLGLGIGAGRLSAGVMGDLNPLSPPGSTQATSLMDIYQRLVDGTPGGTSTFSEPGAGPGSTMKTLDDIMGVAPVADNGGGALPAQVSAGKKYWSLRTDGAGGSSWGLEAGELHGGCTCSGTLHGGRFCDNGDGTVTDLNTCLVWLQDADCLGTADWSGAIQKPPFELKDTVCGLDDGSKWGEWHLPSLGELKGLIQGSPLLVCDPGPCTHHGFKDIQSDRYWTSGKDNDPGSVVYFVHTAFDDSQGLAVPTSTFYIWPVRFP